MVDGSSLENWRTRKGIGGSNPSSSAIYFIINNIRENVTTKVAFPRQYREVKFGNATREERQISKSVATLLPPPTLILFSKRATPVRTTVRPPFSHRHCSISADTGRKQLKFPKTRLLHADSSLLENLVLRGSTAGGLAILSVSDFG